MEQRRANKPVWSYILWSTIFFFGGSFFFFAGSCINMARYQMGDAYSRRDAVMLMDMKGVIFDSKKFLKDLKKYREEDTIKGFVIRVNSPGGVVGPSQELNYEIQRTREEFKKPVVVYSESLNASGAYYASVAANKIVVAPGALIGSIGVIMEFANLRDLYKWAKIERYSIKTGEYKDIGSDYRPMTDKEKKYLQALIDQVLVQFKDAILKGRKISKEKLNEIADGRIFTGSEAKALKLVDDVGSLQAAVDLAGELTGLGKDPETFEVPHERPSVLDFVMGIEDENEESLTKIAQLAEEFANLKLSGQLLYIYPAAIPGSLISSRGSN